MLMRMFMQVLLPAAQQLQLPARPSSRKRAFQTLRSMCVLLRSWGAPGDILRSHDILFSCEIRNTIHYRYTEYTWYYHKQHV